MSTTCGCRNWPGPRGSRSCAVRWRTLSLLASTPRRPAARPARGVVAVLTSQDINDIPPPPPPPEGGPPPGSEAAPLPLGGPWQEPLLAVDQVRFVGESVAIVLTDDGYQGEDAAELVTVDYEPLPVVVGIGEALAGGTLLFPHAGLE